jgi:membrane protease YdiL (CAAX protease family)
MERAVRLSVVIGFAILVVLVAAISLWAHRAEANKSLRSALFVLTGAISIVILLVAVITMIVNINGDRGSVSANSILIVATGFAIGLPLLRPIRVVVSRVMPLDPDSSADTIGLSVLAATAIFFGGTSLAAGADVSVSSVSATELVSQAVALVFVAYFGVGFLITRSFASATDRLGLKSISSRQFWRAVALVLALFTVTIISGYLTSLLQPDLEKQIGNNLNNMTADFSSWSGALILGVSAGVSEEILFRGAIQPRYGIIFTSLVFASLHVQYGISLTILGIFLVSVLLGMERKQVNTTASMVTHVVYDVLAVLLPILFHSS